MRASPAASPALALAAAFACLLACKDDDPIPPGPKGAFQLWGQILPAEQTDMQGFARVDVTAQRVDVEVRTVDELVRYTTVPEPFSLSVFPEIGPTFVLQMEVPAGELQRVILVEPRGTLARATGERFAIAFPGEELAFVPEDGVRWTVAPNSYAAGLAVFDPAQDIAFEPASLLHPRPRYRVAPTIGGGRFDISFETTGIIAGRGMLAFEAGTPRARVEAINAEIGAQIVDVSPSGTRYLVELPYSVSARGAAEHYAAQPEYLAGGLEATAWFALQDRPSRGEIWPNDVDPGDQDNDGSPEQEVQVAHFFSELAKGWRTLDLADDGQLNASVGKLPGGRRLKVAVIDGHFQLDHPDLVPNYAINQAEIPAELAAMIVDVDGRPEISFVDLNDPQNSCTQAEGPCPCYVDLFVNSEGLTPSTDFLTDICEPLDLLADTRWADQIDQDGNGHHSDHAFHGNATSAVVGALGDNRPGGLNASIMSFGHADPEDALLNPGAAGVVWHIDILPIGIEYFQFDKIPNQGPPPEPDEESGWAETGGDAPPEEDDLPAQASDFDLLEALEYAVAQEADIIVMSVSDEVLQRDAWQEASADFLTNPVTGRILGGPNCTQGNVHTVDVDEKTFAAMTLPLRDWWATVDLGPRSTVFVAAGNCQLDWDHPLLESAVAEYLDPQRTVAVGAMKAFSTNEPPLFLSPAVAPYSAYGANTVKAATMTDIYTLDLRKRSGYLYRGTSCAAPHAAGIYAQFLLARILHDPNYLGNTGPEDAIQEFLEISTDPGRPTPGMGDGTVFLDAAKATTKP